MTSLVVGASNRCFWGPPINSIGMKFGKDDFDKYFF
jgi:hypothetical protein